jgi:hypothetical protein
VRSRGRRTARGAPSSPPRRAALPGGRCGSPPLVRSRPRGTGPRATPAGGPGRGPPPPSTSGSRPPQPHTAHAETGAGTRAKDAAATGRAKAQERLIATRSGPRLPRWRARPRPAPPARSSAASMPENGCTAPSSTESCASWGPSSASSNRRRPTISIVCLRLEPERRRGAVARVDHATLDHEGVPHHRDSFGEHEGVSVGGTQHDPGLAVGPRRRAPASRARLAPPRAARGGTTPGTPSLRGEVEDVRVGDADPRPAPPRLGERAAFTGHDLHGRDRDVAERELDRVARGRRPGRRRGGRRGDLHVDVQPTVPGGLAVGEGCSGSREGRGRASHGERAWRGRRSRRGIWQRNPRSSMRHVAAGPSLQDRQAPRPTCPSGGNMILAGVAGLAHGVRSRTLLPAPRAPVPPGREPLSSCGRRLQEPPGIRRRSGPSRARRGPRRDPRPRARAVRPGALLARQHGRRGASPLPGAGDREGPRRHLRRAGAGREPVERARQLLRGLSGARAGCLRRVAHGRGSRAP